MHLRQKMKAAVYYAPLDIRIEDRPIPSKDSDSMIAMVNCCAICGTDIKIYKSGNPRCTPPRIIGHEMAGTLVHVGDEVDGFEAGENITLATTVACGSCDYCKIGLQNVCPNAKPISYDFDGAFAQYIRIPKEAIAGGNVIKIPDGEDTEKYAISEPLSCAINSQDIIQVGENDMVVVVGGGPLGAIHAELAKANGAKKVMVVASSGARFELLKKLEGIDLIDRKSEDVEKRVKELTGGLGADAVIVCAPSREAMEDSLSLARKGGRISFFSSLPSGDSELSICSRVIHYNELIIAGCSDSRPEHVLAAVELIKDGKINCEAIITHRFSIDEFFEGIEVMHNKESLKALIYPWGYAG